MMSRAHRGSLAIGSVLVVSSFLGYLGGCCEGPGTYVSIMFPTEVLPGQSIQFTTYNSVNVCDGRRQETETFQWSGEGTFVSPDQARTEWIAPDQPGEYDISLVYTLASDGQVFRLVSDTVTVLVTPVASNNHCITTPSDLNEAQFTVIESQSELDDLPCTYSTPYEVVVDPTAQLTMALTVPLSNGCAMVRLTGYEFDEGVLTLLFAIQQDRECGEGRNLQRSLLVLTELEPSTVEAFLDDELISMVELE